MNVPANLIFLDAKPGQAWNCEEVARMAAWWAEREQERLVWVAASRYLGAGVTVQDVEEIWIDFYKTLLPRARLSYKPGGPGFCVYLLNVCFKNHCVLQGERIRRRSAREKPHSVSYASGEETVLDRIAENGPDDPQKHAEQNAFLDAVRCALVESNLSPPQKEAFLLRHCRQLSYQEIAGEMNAPIGSVKAWVSRATVRLAGHLKEQGWSL